MLLQYQLWSNYTLTRECVEYCEVCTIWSVLHVAFQYKQPHPLIYIAVAFTDHKPLTFCMAKTSDMWSSRQQRHLAYISEFTTDIRHVQGKNNHVADALSRATISALLAHWPCYSCGCEYSTCTQYSCGCEYSTCTQYSCGCEYSTCTQYSCGCEYSTCTQELRKNRRIGNVLRNKSLILQSLQFGVRPKRLHHSLVHDVYMKYIQKLRSYTLPLVS